MSRARLRRVAEAWRTGLRTYLAATKADVTPSLRVGEFRASVGQSALREARVRMRGTEDPTSPLDYVLHDGLNFEQVVACVEIKNIKC